MIQYLSWVSDPANLERAAQILTKAQSADVITEGSVEYQLKQLEKLKEIGEGSLYQKILKDLKKNPDYRGYLK